MVSVVSTCMCRQGVGGTGGEVSVLAGSGADPAGRVAYVRTVQPGSDVNQPLVHPRSTQPAVQPGTAAAAAAAAADDDDDAGQQRTMVVAADINTVSCCCCCCVQPLSSSVIS